MKARISLLNKKESEWLKLGTWVPEAGEPVIYNPDAKYKYTRIKIGDGVRMLQELDFCMDSTVEDLLWSDKQNIIDAGRITDYIN